jgi:hypothetical protein
MTFLLYCSPSLFKFAKFCEILRTSADPFYFPLFDPLMLPACLRPFVDWCAPVTASFVTRMHRPHMPLSLCYSAQKLRAPISALTLSPLLSMGVYVPLLPCIVIGGALTTSAQVLFPPVFSPFRADFLRTITSFSPPFFNFHY